MICSSSKGRERKVGLLKVSSNIMSLPWVLFCLAELEVESGAYIHVHGSPASEVVLWPLGGWGTVGLCHSAVPLALRSWLGLERG